MMEKWNASKTESKIINIPINTFMIPVYRKLTKTSMIKAAAR